MRKFLTQFFFAGLLGTALCIEWSFKKKGFSTLSYNSPPMCIHSRKQIMKCCGVYGSIPECTAVVLNNDHCICSSEPIAYVLQVDYNTSLYIKRPKSCPPSYKFINNVCIKVSTDLLTWHESKLDCENTGGNLIILDSLEKHQRVFDLVTQYFSDVAKKYFVGASDIEEEGNWKWIMENSATYMHDSNLNDVDFNYDGLSADCGALNFETNKIIDEFCDGPSYYICEIMFE